MPQAVTVVQALYALLLLLVLPLLAKASQRRFDEGRVPSGRRLFLQLTAQLAVLGALAAVVAALSGLPVLAAPRWDAWALGGAAAFLAGAVLTMPWRWRRTPAADRARLARLLPREGGDAAAWTLTCVAAGVAEELAYRGVLTALLARWTGSSIAGAVLSAAAFAAAHAVQGARSMLVVFAFALGFQGLCHMTGSLLPAMLVHALYDLVAGLAYARLAAREPAAGGTPPPAAPGEPDGDRGPAEDEPGVT